MSYRVALDDSIVYELLIKINLNNLKMCRLGCAMLNN